VVGGGVEGLVGVMMLDELELELDVYCSLIRRNSRITEI
jgi:hypothetical protein